MHILVKYTSKDEHFTHHYLIVWIKSDLEWTSWISSKMLNSKKLSLSPDDYLIMLEQDGTPFHEIGIPMAGRYWCTNKDQNYSRCSIFLLWYGHLDFCDTKQKGLTPTPKSSPKVKEHATYHLWPCKPQSPDKKLVPVKPNEPIVLKGRSNLNSLKAGILDPREIEKLKDKLKSMPVPKPLEKEPKPITKLKNITSSSSEGTLSVAQHGVHKRKPKKRNTVWCVKQDSQASCSAVHMSKQCTLQLNTVASIATKNTSHFHLCTSMKKVMQWSNMFVSTVANHFSFIIDS